MISTFAVRRDAYEYLEEVLFEFITIGQSVKVCAVDPNTGVEVSIVGPLNESSRELKHIAMAKLNYVLGKRAEARRDG